MGSYLGSLWLKRRKFGDKEDFFGLWMKIYIFYSLTKLFILFLIK
jgi:hypothetical protein